MKETEKLLILGRMSAMIAHEIRNPLAGISAVTQVLEGKIEPNDPRRHYVSLILKEIDHVNKLVHDLLDYTREHKPYFLPSEVTALANRALSVFVDELQKKGIAVKKDFHENEMIIPLDQEKIERAFKNIITNAIEAIDKRGCITISTKSVNGLRKKDNGIEIAFSDTGKGSELKKLRALFSPFYTTKAKGTGLGLAVGQKIVEEHHGRIWAEKNPDKGLTVRIFLPREQPVFNKKKKQQQEGKK